MFVFLTRAVAANQIKEGRRHGERHLTDPSNANYYFQMSVFCTVLKNWPDVCTAGASLSWWPVLSKGEMLTWNQSLICIVVLVLQSQ